MSFVQIVAFSLSHFLLGYTCSVKMNSEFVKAEALSSASPKLHLKSMIPLLVSSNLHSPQE
jgi:hypothetical protein